MKILQNSVLVLLLPLFASYASGYEVIGISSDLASSFATLLDALDSDTVLYAQLQNELEDVAVEFDSSADERRHLYCCVSYAFDMLNQQFAEREQELLAIIADRDQTIAEAASEIESLYEMLDVLTLQLESRDTKLMYITPDGLNHILEHIQAKYDAMNEQRTNFLMMLDAIADKMYGHFEVEAIEGAVFGEQICGTMYCPELDNLDESEEDMIADDQNGVEVLDFGETLYESFDDSIASAQDEFDLLD